MESIYVIVQFYISALLLVHSAGSCRYTGHVSGYAIIVISTYSRIGGYECFGFHPVFAGWKLFNSIPVLILPGI